MLPSSMGWNLNLVAEMDIAVNMEWWKTYGKQILRLPFRWIFLLKQNYFCKYHDVRWWFSETRFLFQLWSVHQWTSRSVVRKHWTRWIKHTIEKWSRWKVQQILDSLKSKTWLYIDDATTGAADGYAVDFIKILVNEKKDIKVGKATLRWCFDKVSGKAISGATVELSEGATMKTTTKANILFRCYSGLVVVEVTAPGYKTQTVTIDVIVGQANTIDVFLVK